MKLKPNWMWMAVAIVAALLLFNSGIIKKEAGETLNRVVSATTVAPGSTFTIKYVVPNPAGAFFFSIKDNLAGGCTVSTGGDTIIKTLSSPDTETTTVTINAPASEGTCTINGDYMLGSNPLVNFPTSTITVCSAVNGGWSVWGAWSDPILECGTRSRTCTNPTPSCGGATCVGSSTETKSCVCTIFGDTYPACDGIKRAELGAVAQQWIANPSDNTLRTNLGIAAQDWIANGGPA